MKKLKQKVQICVIRKTQNQGYEALLLQTNKKRGKFWQNVTGSVDKGDQDLAYAARRETWEETGLPSDSLIEFFDLNMNFYFFDERRQKQIDEHVFCVLVTSDWEVQICSKEHQAYKWRSLKKIKRKDLRYEQNYLALQRCREIFLPPSFSSVLLSHLR